MSELNLESFEITEPDGLKQTVMAVALSGVSLVAGNSEHAWVIFKHRGPVEATNGRALRQWWRGVQAKRDYQDTADSTLKAMLTAHGLDASGYTTRDELLGAVIELHMNS